LTAIHIDRPTSLTRIVTERLRKAIVEAELGLGEALSEDRLATMLGVSRTPVREALTMLQWQGLINVVPKRGTFVFLPSERDIADLCEYRLCMETQAVGRCLEVAHQPTLAAMRHAITAMQAALHDNNPLASARADAAFHDAFFANCGSRYFQEGYAVAAGRISALRAHMAQPPLGEQQRAFAEHQEIAEAFAARDQGRLTRVLESHVRNMRRTYVAALHEGLFGPTETGQPIQKRPRKQPPEGQSVRR
jgi:DNA-binding GntR family transcriptional regulator